MDVPLRNDRDIVNYFFGANYAIRSREIARNSNLNPGDKHLLADQRLHLDNIVRSYNAALLAVHREITKQRDNSLQELKRRNALTLLGPELVGEEMWKLATAKANAMARAWAGLSGGNVNGQLDGAVDGGYYLVSEPDLLPPDYRRGAYRTSKGKYLLARPNQLSADWHRRQGEMLHILEDYFTTVIGLFVGWGMLPEGGADKLMRRFMEKLAVEADLLGKI